MRGRPPAVVAVRKVPVNVRVHTPSYGTSDWTSLTMSTGRMRVSCMLTVKELHDLGAQVLAAIEHHKRRVDYELERRKEAALNRQRTMRRIVKKR